MAGRGDRFRRLRTAKGDSATGDLFEHYGVATEPPPDPPAGPGPVVAASACDHCGWYRALPVRGPCPLCGGPGRTASPTP